MKQNGEVIQLFPKSMKDVIAENRARRKAETEQLEAEIKELKRKIETFKKKDDGTFNF